VGTSEPSFGVSLDSAQSLGNCTQPLLLLGYGHEVLDRLTGINPSTAFLPCIERYLWSPDEGWQIFHLPHVIPSTSGRFSIYSNHIQYDAYRVSILPASTEVLGTNFGGDGAQLLWFRNYQHNPHIYYWGINQVINLNTHGHQFCENLIHWLIRQSLQERLGETLAAWQLVSNSSVNFWEMQGAGGFGYPLEPSIRLSYYVTDMVNRHSLAVNLSAFGSWLQSRYNSTSGCFEDLASPQLHDRCVTTAMAVLLSEKLGLLGELNQTSIGDYLVSCQDPNSGGFFSDYSSSQTSLKATRFALESLQVLDQLSKINIQAAINYVTQCQELNPLNSQYGGFYPSDLGGFSANLIDTTYAIAALDQVSALNAINQSALSTFIASCEDPVGSSIFDTRHTLDSDEWVLGTACSIQICTTLALQGLYNPNISRAYLIDNQYPNGGWGRGDLLHDFHNSPDETWYTVYALSLTGGLGSAEQNLTQYLIHCCTQWGGASEPVIFGDFLTSYEILETLSHINGVQRVNLTAFLSFLDNCWSQSRTSFTAHQFPSAVGIDTDSPTPDRIALETGTFGPLYHYAFSQLISILNLTSSLWITRASQLRQEIVACQTDAITHSGMLGLHHLYVGHESDLTFRFDTTCWNLLAHQGLGGIPTDLINDTAVHSYLLQCLQGNTTHQYFHDSIHTIPIPAQWREADGYLAETWLGLQAVNYLDPSLSNLDGQKLATYATSFLQENVSLISTYYITEILTFLVETGLNPAALDLLDRDTIRPKLLNSFTFEGLVIDPSYPPGKWTPHLINLGIKLVHRLQLLSHLDVNPILNLTGITYPTGTLLLGTNFMISASIQENRWGHLPPRIYVKTQIFNTTFTNNSSPILPGYYEFKDYVPISSGALGPQNLSIIAFFPGTIPSYMRIPAICIGWGNLSTQTVLIPSATIPRSIPLNVTVEISLEGAQSSTAPLGNGNVSVTVESTSTTYPASQYTPNLYNALVPTENLSITLHLIRINASIPYCTPHTEITPMSVIVYDTHLTLEQTIPTNPVLFDQTTLVVGLWNASGSPLSGYQVNFTLTRPGESVEYMTSSHNTNETGLALCSWNPDKIGSWEVIFRFSGAEMFNGCITEVDISVIRRPIACTITQYPSSTVFIGNECWIELYVFDELDGYPLPNANIQLFENGQLIASNTSDANGRIVSHWLTSAPVGVKELQIEVSGTSTHELWLSSSFEYVVRDTTSISLFTETNQLYIGETVYIQVLLSASASGPPNGTASIYWDGSWNQDILITNGMSTFSLQIEYSELAGEHLVIVLFGHLDAPDTYPENSSTLLITLQEIVVPTITLTITPIEIDDPYLQPTIEIVIRLTYREGSLSRGLSTNLSVGIYSEEDLLLERFSILTNTSGLGHLIISTPVPGIYSVIAHFEGQRGLAPTSTKVPFLVRDSLNPLASIFSPLLVASLAIMLLGFFIGGFLFLWLQNRLNKFLKQLQPRQSLTPLESSELLSILNHSSVSQSDSVNHEDD
jgi:prenyltransferase beta subunit